MTFRGAVVLLALAAPVAAEEATDPKTEAARWRFAHGTELYSEGKFAAAMVEFEAARQLKPLPAFHFNIARCLERLERWGEAAAEYERYLAAAPDAPERLELRSHIGVLKSRGEPLLPMPPPTVVRRDEPRRRRRARSAR